MTTRRALVFGAVIALGVVIALLFQSHGGRREAPPEDPPAELAPAEPAPPPPTPVSPPLPVAPPPPAPAAGASPPPSPAAPTPTPSPTEERPDAGARAKPLGRMGMGAVIESARLYADLARIGRPVPPEARTLVEMKRAGASAEELSAFIKSSFPDDLITRATAQKWVRMNTPAAADGGAPARTQILKTTPGP